MEVDYQMALLLQHQFEQEHRKRKQPESDYEIALQLQEQFKSEVEIDQPKNNLVYSSKKAKKNADSSKSLVDPSWEVIDPTPDIHVLFIAFDSRFFWSALSSVVVSWSKRMTTCAGVCSYQGRGGMCTITLSEPLLKLRPRKDLVETLLHEMIHAYLFVTNNNRDRDGHGPEFHKHMYRINSEAGTNITVYHDFHDEVRLYQQHWWRCSGPCQNWKPYFGMVRRATNRAPGPNDFWWSNHNARCGGNFIKVKEPEKSKREKNPKSKVSGTNNDIRKFIKTTSNSPSQKDIKENQTKTNKTEFTSKHSNSKKPKILSVINNNEANIHKTPKKTSANASNIFGFSDLNGRSDLEKKRPTLGGVRNASSTIVINKKTCTDVKKDDIVKPNLSPTPFTGTGQALDSHSNTSNPDYSLVRNHWINKFETKTSKEVKTKLVQEDIEKATCPVCNLNVPIKELNSHLDVCLVEPKGNGFKECVICRNNIPADDYQKHVADCDAIDLTEPKPNVTKKCPVCKESLDESQYEHHVEQCLFKIFDELEDEYELEKDKKTPCLACGKDILKSDLNLHLEECMNMSNVFDTSNVFVIDDEEENVQKTYNCPFCLQLIPEEQMQTHLDKCLEEVACSPEAELNKSIVKDTFCEELMF